MSDNQDDSSTDVDIWENLLGTSFSPAYEENNNNSDTSQYDSDEEEDDDSSYYEEEDEPEVIAGWIHDYNNFTIELTKSDPVNNLLKQVLHEEIRHIENTVMRLTSNGLLNEIKNVFLEQLYFFYRITFY